MLYQDCMNRVSINLRNLAQIHETKWSGFLESYEICNISLGSMRSKAKVACILFSSSGVGHFSVVAYNPAAK